MIDADLGRGIVFNAATSSRIYFSRMRGRQRQRQSRMPIATPLPMRAGCSCIMASSAGGRACPGVELLFPMPFTRPPTSCRLLSGRRAAVLWARLIYYNAEETDSDFNGRRPFISDVSNRAFKL